MDQFGNSLKWEFEKKGGETLNFSQKRKEEIAYGSRRV